MVRARLLGPLLVPVLLVAGCSSYGEATRPAHATASRRAPAVSGGVVVAAAAPSPRPRGKPARLPAAAVLHAWDRRRADAWAAGDVHALADLYVHRSTAGRGDVALLKAYLRRGLRVTGMRMQVFSLRVLHHAPRRWRLLVTDRLARAVAVSAAGSILLPRDGAATRVVGLVRGADGRWRVTTVRAARR
ncbi:MAG TPA: hypothetical protein VFT75_00040 [Nocardioidaceae bacterium]|nr:hypothetical protein [Nocardioidaceae bacterium]